jgi:rhamnogalacturonan hydrolase
MKFNLSLLSAFVLPSLVAAQLSGTVGPLTSRDTKAATKVCNILNYGGVASATTDNAAAITSAWAACISGGEGWAPLLLVCFQLTLKSLHSFWKLWSGDLDHSHWW